MAEHKCSCCGAMVDESEWDYLYTACHACATEHSLQAYPCNHGKDNDAG